VLRLTTEQTPYITDGGHYNLDCSFDTDSPLQSRAVDLHNTVGLVETGCFWAWQPKFMLEVSERSHPPEEHDVFSRAENYLTLKWISLTLHDRHQTCGFGATKPIRTSILAKSIDHRRSNEGRVAIAKITVVPVRSSIRALMGSGRNVVILPGSDGKLSVDSGFATSRAQITEALAGISPEPLRHVVNTHWRFDHTDGNEWMHEAGATIIAQEKVRDRMSSRQTIPAFDAILALLLRQPCPQSSSHKLTRPPSTAKSSN
jgi:Metallo-beta-lactamase superfamily